MKSHSGAYFEHGNYDMDFSLKVITKCNQSEAENESLFDSNCISPGASRKRQAPKRKAVSPSSSSNSDTEYSRNRFSDLQKPPQSREKYLIWLRLMIKLIELLLENWEFCSLESRTIVAAIESMFPADHNERRIFQTRRTRSHEKLQCIHSRLVLEHKAIKQNYQGISSRNGQWYMKSNLEGLEILIDMVSQLMMSRKERNPVSTFHTKSDMYSSASAITLTSTSCDLPGLSSQTTLPTKVPLISPTSFTQRSHVPVTRIFQSETPGWSVRWTDYHQSRNVSPSLLSSKATFSESIGSILRDVLSKVKRKSDHVVVLRGT